MHLRIRMRLIYSVKCRYAIRLKFRDKFLTSLTKLVLEMKSSIYSTIKENILLYLFKFLAFAFVVIKSCTFITRPVPQRNTACNRNHYFTIESLAFQNRLLNGAHSMSDIKLPCSYKLHQ